MEQEIAAIITSNAFWGLIGALLGAACSYFSIRTQLKHQAVESKITREHDLRKQVYLEAIEAIAQMQLLLLSLANIKSDELTVDYKISASLTKLHAVSKLPLVEKLLACQSYYSTAFMELCLEKVSIDTKEQEANSELEEHQRTLQQYQNLTSYYADATPQERAAIEEQHVILQKEMEECLEKHSRLNNEVFDERMKLLANCTKHSSAFSNLLTECLVDVREELDNRFSHEEGAIYKRISSENSDKILQNMNQFIEKVRQQASND